MKLSKSIWKDCAIAANADCIVSEDAHFKILESIPFPHVSLLRLKEFANVLVALRHGAV